MSQSKLIRVWILISIWLLASIATNIEMAVVFPHLFALPGWKVIVIAAITFTWALLIIAAIITNGPLKVVVSFIAGVVTAAFTLVMALKVNPSPDPILLLIACGSIGAAVLLGTHRVFDGP